MITHFLSLSFAPSDRMVTSVQAVVLAISDKPCFCFFFFRLSSFFFIFAFHAFFRASSMFLAALLSARDCDRLLSWLPDRSNWRDREWNHLDERPGVERPGGAVAGTFLSGAML